MRKLLPLLIPLLAIIVFASFAPQEAPTPAELPAGAAAIADFKGEVSIQSPQAVAITPQKGVVLDADTTIETGKGRVLLNLQDGSQILVKDRSRLVLLNPEQQKHFYLELLIGKIVAKVQKRLGNTPSFRMGTPSAVITVRGTRFSVEVSKKQRTFVEVFEGRVEVQGFASLGRAVMIQPGFYTNIERDRDPDQPRQMMERGEGMQSNREGPGGFDREGQQPSGNRPDSQSGERESDH